MMENKLVQRFINEVNEVISSEIERDELFDALKRYQELSDVRCLINDLRKVLNEPMKLDIYEYVRPLVRPQHQQQYDKMAPSAPGQRLRVIRLRRRQNESLGFAVRGGYEHNIGVFVSLVEAGSQAEQHGLKVGDEIVRVNGFTIVEAIHEEVLNLIKGKDEIELKVTNIGMLPIKRSPNDPVTWQYVDKTGNILQQVQSSTAQTAAPPEEIKIFINTRGAAGLGCMIMSGPKGFPGVFIESVKSGGLAEAYRLEVGDQIMEVNGKSFHAIKHEEAIVELKGSKELNMVIRKGTGLPFMNARNTEKKSPQQQRSHAGRSHAGPSYDHTRSPEILENIEMEERRLWEEEQKRLKKQKEEEHARLLLRQKEMDKQAEVERKRKEEENRRHEEEKQRKIEKARKQQEAELRQKEEEQQRKKDEELEKRIQIEKQKQKEADEKKRKKEIIQQKQEVPSPKGCKRKQKEKDFYRRVRFNQKQAEQARQICLFDRKLELDALRSFRSAVLAGRAGPVSAIKPTLLGAADVSPQIPAVATGDREVKEVVIRKEEDIPLDLEIEGGIDSPLGGKIVVAEVYHSGLADKNGGIKRGDTLLKVNDTSLEDKTLNAAQEILWNAEQNSKDTIRLIVVESDFSRMEDEITYF